MVPPANNPNNQVIDYDVSQPNSALEHIDVQSSPYDIQEHYFMSENKKGMMDTNHIGGSTKNLLAPTSKELNLK